MNACWGKKHVHFLTKSREKYGIKEHANLGKLTDFQIRCNNPYIHLL